MDNEKARRLVELNNDFYLLQAESFSGSRQSAWKGWERACAHLSPPRSVLDVACGNMRFRKFLCERFPGAPIDYHALDSCTALLPADMPEQTTFQQLDVLGVLLDGGDLVSAIGAPQCDLVACFGFMHHVPGHAARVATLNALVQKAAPDGLVVVSFWQFARNERLLEKARATTARGVNELELSLEAGDYLVGWNDEPHVYRYCHSFTDDEIDDLAESLRGSMAIVDRFRADGRTGDLNSYVVFRREM